MKLLLGRDSMLHGLKMAAGVCRKILSMNHLSPASLNAAFLVNRMRAAVLANRTLSIAITLSVLVHGILLTVRFVSPETFRLPPADPGLEVVLVNARHNKRPMNPEALAQANMDGGGNADAGRAKSPLPDMGQVSDGDALRHSRRKVQMLQEEQRKMVAQLNGNPRFRAVPLKPSPDRDTAPVQDSGMDVYDSTSILQRRAAEIARTIEEQNRRPKKTYITPSTREVGYAMYYKSMQRKIENVGTLNFPQQDGKKLYGELTLHIPIFQDGSIYEKDGGIQVARESGVPGLDAAAIRIVRRAAPFGPFPANMLSSSGTDLWIVTTRFIFTREQGLATQVHAAD